MTEPSVEEIVAWLESGIAIGPGRLSVPVSHLGALIDDWRKRGEALEPFASQAARYDPLGMPQDTNQTAAWDYCDMPVRSTDMCVGWFRDARDALTPQQPPG